MNKSFSRLRDFTSKAEIYCGIRVTNPGIKAADVKSYVDYRIDGGHETIEQFLCSHEFVINEESNRCYCIYCGLDGDA